MLLLLAVLTTATTWAEKNPVVVYSVQNKTLYFSYRDLTELHNGQFTPEGSSSALTIFSSEWFTEIQGDHRITESGDIPAWLNLARENTTTVVIESSFANVKPKSMNRWFSSFTQLTSIRGLEYLNTSEVTTMRQTFHGCSALTSLDLRNFDTSKVTDMYGMFNDCSSLTMLDLSSFNTSLVTNMRMMFRNCGNLVTIFIGDSWDTSSVADSGLIFQNCSSLVGYDGTHCSGDWILDKSYAHAGAGGFMCKHIPYAVYCASNQTLYFTYPLRLVEAGGTFTPEGSSTPLAVTNVWSGTDVTETEGYPTYPGWHIGAVQSGATHVVFESTFADVQPTNTAGWFHLFYNLSDIQGLEYLDTRQVTKMGAMFQGCSALTELDLSHFDTHNVTTMSSMFNGCNKLESVFIGDGWDTSSLLSSDYMFYDCTSIAGQDGTTYDANYTDKSKAHAGEGGYMRTFLPCAVYCESTKTLYFTANRRTLTAGDTFTPEDSSTPLTVTDSWRGTDVTDTGTNGVKWLSSLQTSENLTRVVFEPSFAKVRPTSTAKWFSYFYFLTNIEGMEYLNTSDVTDMSEMFSLCKALYNSSLKMGHFDTRKVTNMSIMFGNCENLTRIDLGAFNTSQVTNMESMFYNCHNVQNIFIGRGWDTSKVTSGDNMFYNCVEIKGENTDYNSNKTGVSMAHGMLGGYMCYPRLYLDNDNNNNGAPLAEAKANGNIYSASLGKRTLYRNGDWNTLCLPFTMTTFEGSSLEGATVMELDVDGTYDGHQTGIDGTTLYLYFKPATSIVAGQPYIVKWETTGDPITYPVFPGITVTSTTPGVVTSQDGSLQFKGTYDPVPLTAGDKSTLYLGSGNQLYWPSADLDINAFRAYFKLDLGTSSAPLNFVLNLGDGNATGIVEAEADASRFTHHSSLSEWHTLDGRKLPAKPTQKGVYIYQGRVVVIK